MEVCVDNLHSAINALEGGAIRLELCCGLSEGGLTPTPGFVKQVKKIVGTRPATIHALIRARGGDFSYSEPEIDMMADDARQLVVAGVDGIVIGCLDAYGDVDVAACKAIIAAAQQGCKERTEDAQYLSLVNVCFHRAFDVCRDGRQSMFRIRGMGINRLLTSGQSATALEGAEFIGNLIRTYPEVEIMPGGGITEQNLAEILRKTGAKTFHASAREEVPCHSEFRRECCKMGSNSNEYSLMITSVDRVTNMVSIFNSVSSGIE